MKSVPRCPCCRAKNLMRKSRELLALHELMLRTEDAERFDEKPSLNSLGYVVSLVFGICWNCWHNAIGLLTADRLFAARSSP